MNDTPNLKIPYLMAAQAQKHVTHNEALRALDAVVQLSVLDRDLSTPPGSPADGDRYIVGPSASGDWLGKEGEIVAWQDNAWMFYAPIEGWICWVADEDKLLVWDSSAWAEISGAASVNPAALVGVNTTADTTNRLSVKSDAVLFSHDDVTPGSGDIQTKLNKSLEGDTASFLFQTNWSGRAEIGLTGDDDFHFKVSDDGSNWNDGIIIDEASGEVSMPNSSFSQNMVFNLLEDAGRFAGSPEPAGRSVGSFASPTYLSAYNGAAFSGHGQFINNNSTNGGAAGALDSETAALMSKLKNSGSPRRYGPEFWVMKIIAGSGTASIVNVEGTDHYLTFTNSAVPLWSKSSWGLNIKCLSGAMAFGKASKWDTYVDGALMGAHTAYDGSDGWLQSVHLGIQDPKATFDDNNGMFGIYATPGAEILIALPFIFPGWVTPKVGSPFGRVPSLRGWR